MRRKLGIASVVVAAALGLLAVAAYAAGAGEETTGGSAVFTLGISALLLWLVSAYSLSVDHVCGRIQTWLESKQQSQL